MGWVEVHTTRDTVCWPLLARDGPPMQQNSWRNTAAYRSCKKTGISLQDRVISIIMIEIVSHLGVKRPCLESILYHAPMPSYVLLARCNSNCACIPCGFSQGIQSCSVFSGFLVLTALSLLAMHIFTSHSRPTLADANCLLSCWPAQTGYAGVGFSVGRRPTLDFGATDHQNTRSLVRQIARPSGLQHRRTTAQLCTSLGPDPRIVASLPHQCYTIVPSARQSTALHPTQAHLLGPVIRCIALPI